MTTRILFAVLCCWFTQAGWLDTVVRADVVWVEAESFEHYGGWTNDAQFIDQMGSPYLLAIGLDGPVKDAVTTVHIPEAGTYHVWARTRDWVPDFSPGRFQIGVGGKVLKHVFGQTKKPGWVWEDGGSCVLDAGNCELRLHDLTGHYGRCDCIVLTNDPALPPAEGKSNLAILRERFGGVSRQVKNVGPYDTVVVGGGLAGTFAAIASARHGCRTALIQNRPVLGGNASTEVLVGPQGDTTREPLDPGEGGIIESVRGPVDLYSERLLKMVKQQKNLDLYLNTHATGVDMRDSRTLAALFALNVRSGQRLRVPASSFIDCTGDGVIGVWAGAEYRHGREGRSLYGEPIAPPEGDSHTMGGTLRYASSLASGPVDFVTPPWARQFTRPEDFTPGREPQLRFGGWQWKIEYGGMLNTYDNAEEIRDELLRIIWGMWGFVKNYSPKLKDEARNYKLAWVSYVVGKRESRRLIGDYVVTEQDVANQTLFPDRVSYCGWGIDLHPPGGFYDQRPPAEFFFRQKSSVPFRSLYTKDIDNLMMAGRCISVSHVALGTTRVMITCGLQGQAVGTAAALCRQYHVSPRQVGNEHIDELQQQLLKDGCYLIDLPNRDPNDLARQATITASSRSVVLNQHSYLGQLGAHPLGHDRAVMFRCKAKQIRSISLFLESENKKAVTLPLTLFSTDNEDDFQWGELFQSGKLVGKATAEVPPQSKSWIRFPLNASAKPGIYYYVALPKTSGISWWLFASEPKNTARAYRVPGSEHSWVRRTGCYCFRVDPEADTGLTRPPKATIDDIFTPINVINGYARAVRGWPNSWRPAADANSPHWLQLDFGKTVSCNTIHVSFQTKQLNATQFRIQVADGDSWKTVAEVHDNEDRRRVVTFPTIQTDKVRLMIDRAAPEMGVCEIRVYNEP